MTIEYFDYCYIYELVLDNIIYDSRAKDGTWCNMHYPNHKHGCPQYPPCIDERIDWYEIRRNRYRWYAFVRRFSINEHATLMKDKNKKLTDKQRRCVLYYQRGINKTIKDSMLKWFNIKDFDKVLLLDRPEANGINMYSTMSKHGLNLKANYDDIICKIMIIGIPKTENYKQVKLCQ